MNSEKEFVAKIIKRRKSVYPKDFKTNIKIEDSVIEEILDNAVWAPNHGLNQPWFFKVFKEKGILVFFEKMKEIYKEISGEKGISEKKLLKYDEKAKQVSHIIAVCMKRDSARRFPEIEDIIATACVIQNIYLQLAPTGISGYLSTGDVCYSPLIKDFLNLKEDEKCLGFFQLGIPTDNLNLPLKKRIPASEKTEWIK